MNADYKAFLAAKVAVDTPTGFDPPADLNPLLFPFQAAIVRWACLRGRAAVWADCGLGKSFIALEWSRLVAEHTRRPVLILTPLAVAEQFVSEGAKFSEQIRLCRDGAEVGAGVNVTNYERLHRFDVSRFSGVVADESSILKDFSSQTRKTLVESFAATPFRLACTATPAPNDFTELGNHAEFLGAMTRTEMLSRFFVHDGGNTQEWRLKRHAEADFWRWVCSWAVALRTPSDIGFSDEGYKLPGLEIQDEIVRNSDDLAQAEGLLFAVEAKTLDEQRAARRSSLPERVARCAELVAAEPAEPWIIWCDLNAESDALTAAIPGAVEVRGSDDAEEKVENLRRFSTGEIKRLVTKPSIAGHGMNWQHCARVAFVGLSHSWEQWYQAIRRTYRFGQTRPVRCHMISSEAEGAVAANLRRKQADAERMLASMVGAVSELQAETFGALVRSRDEYLPTSRITLPPWLFTEAA